MDRIASPSDSWPSTLVGADVDPRHTFQRTPATLAAQAGNTETEAMLKRFGNRVAVTPEPAQNRPRLFALASMPATRTRG